MRDGPVTWEVGKQSHTTLFADGQTTEGVNVPVILSTGETFTVFVPRDTYSEGPEVVRGVLQAAVDNHAAIGGLTGQAGS